MLSFKFKVKFFKKLNIHFQINVNISKMRIRTVTILFKWNLLSTTGYTSDVLTVLIAYLEQIIYIQEGHDRNKAATRRRNKRGVEGSNQQRTVSVKSIG